MNTGIELFVQLFIGIIKLAIGVFIFYEADKIINKLIDNRRRKNRSTPSE